MRKSPDGVELEVARNIYSANFKADDPKKNKHGVKVHIEVGPSGKVNTQDLYYVLKFW